MLTEQIIDPQIIDPQIVDPNDLFENVKFRGKSLSSKFSRARYEVMPVPGFGESNGK